MKSIFLAFILGCGVTFAYIHKNPDLLQQSDHIVDSILKIKTNLKKQYSAQSILVDTQLTNSVAKKTEQVEQKLPFTELTPDLESNLEQNTTLVKPEDAICQCGNKEQNILCLSKFLQKQSDNGGELCGA